MRRTPNSKDNTILEPPRGGVTVAELIAGLAIEAIAGDESTCVTSIIEDSREAGAGSLFIARPGTQTDGKRFIDDACQRGAVAVLSGPGSSVPAGIVHLQTADVPQQGAILAERFFGNPASALRLIGITGTNGKTTTSFIIHQILQHAGTRCGLIGTVHVDVGTGPLPASLTTPPAIEISRLCRSMVDHGCSAAVIEVSSHALAQGRVAGLTFDAAVFTNLSGDHLDYHDSMDDYAAAKAMLFRQVRSAGVGIINQDDDVAPRMIESCAGEVLTCSVQSPAADCRGEIVRSAADHTDATLAGPWGVIELRLPLVGGHNVANALQAAAVCHTLGLDGEAIRAGLEACAAPPGRLEPASTPDDEISVLVDYAHTDAALENVLQAVRPLVPEGGRLAVVFGCGGDRDRTKRPRMARAACSLADRIYITSDNPRTEPPEAIVEEILTGVSAQDVGRTEVMVDRGMAINAAIDNAQPGDIVLIAGKGHEDYQIIGTKRSHFDDRETARTALTNRRARQRKGAPVA